MTPSDLPPFEAPAAAHMEATAPVRAEGPFRVLIVCTANQCRSPLAEHLLRQAVERRGLDWSISSAGTQAADGNPMDPNAESVLLERMAPPSRWTSQALTVNLITSADLILTADVEHRQIVTMMVPSASRRVFTLLQFARFTQQFPATFGPIHSGDDLLRSAGGVRVLLQPPAPGEDDLADPIGRSIRAFRVCADTITQATEQILAPVTPG